MKSLEFINKMQKKYKKNLLSKGINPALKRAPPSAERMKRIVGPEPSFIPGKYMIRMEMNRKYSIAARN